MNLSHSFDAVRTLIKKTKNCRCSLSSVAQWLFIKSESLHSLETFSKSYETEFRTQNVDDARYLRAKVRKSLAASDMLLIIYITKFDKWTSSLFERKLWLPFMKINASLSRLPLRYSEMPHKLPSRGKWKNPSKEI